MKSVTFMRRERGNKINKKGEIALAISPAKVPEAPLTDLNLEIVDLFF